MRETLGVEGANEVASFEQAIEAGKTVKHLLNQLADKYPRFAETVYDARIQKLAESVSIYFNGRHLELANGLETRLSEGDILVFLPVIAGG